METYLKATTIDGQHLLYSSASFLKGSDCNFHYHYYFFPFYVEEVLIMRKGRDCCCNFHVGGINYAGPMLIVANHPGAYFESIPPFLPVYLLYPNSS